MYIFKSDKSNVIVWDSEQDKALCRFKGGAFETQDKTLAKKLIAAGYKMEGDNMLTELSRETVIKKRAESVASPAPIDPEPQEVTEVKKTKTKNKNTESSDADV